MKRTIEVDVWSDVACPWCWIGKRRLEEAIRTFEKNHAADDVSVAVAVTWRAFELDSSAPREHNPSVSHVEMLARKLRKSPAQAQQMLANMTGLGASEGLKFDFAQVKASNTFDAHRVIHLAGERGLQNAMKDRLMRGYFSEGEHMADTATLVRLAAEVGLDAEATRAMLASDALTKDVREDQEQARAMGAGGVPFFVVDRSFAVEGAQPADVLARVLEQAFTAGGLERVETAASADAPVCDDDSCAT